METRRRGTTSLAAAALAVLLLSGCSAAASDSNDGTQSDTVKISVGLLPIVDSMGFWFALDKGYFSDEGLDVSYESTNAGAMVTNLVNGTYQMALAEPAIVVEAFDKGLPLRIVGAATRITDKPAEDTGLVLVAKGSKITSPADLNGTTIAVGALHGGGELSLRAAIDKAGADSGQVKLVEMPLSDMTAALEKGQVDAISTISPFDSIAVANGATRIMSPGAEAAPGAMQIAVATSAQFKDANPDAVDGFLAALEKGTAYAAAHPDEVRASLPEISPVPEDLIASMNLPVFDMSSPREALKLWTDMMKRYDFVSKPVDLDELMG